MEYVWGQIKDYLVWYYLLSTKLYISLTLVSWALKISSFDFYGCYSYPDWKTFSMVISLFGNVDHPSLVITT